MLSGDGPGGPLTLTEGDSLAEPEPEPEAEAERVSFTELLGEPEKEAEPESWEPLALPLMLATALEVALPHTEAEKEDEEV